MMRMPLLWANLGLLLLTAGAGAEWILDGVRPADRVVTTSGVSRNTITYAGTNVYMDLALGMAQFVTLTNNAYIHAPSNVVQDMGWSLYLVQDSTGSRTVTWDAVYDWGDAGEPTLTTAANGMDRIGFEAYTTTNVISGFDGGFLQ